MLAACSPPAGPSAASLQAVGSLQELMQAVIDPSADGVWDAVETTTSSAGETVRRPQTSEQWLEVRRSALTLAESANLLLIDGRRVGAHDFPAEAQGALDLARIQELIAAKRASFNAFAAALRAAALASLAAIDAQDPTRLVSAGGTIDEVCEGCHLTFWYPNQVIPPLPSRLQSSTAGVAGAGSVTAVSKSAQFAAQK